MTVDEDDQTTPAPQRHRAKSSSRMTSGFSTVRDIVTFAAGLGFVANEVFISSTAEPAVIAVGITMMGLPLVFGADERKRGGGSK